MVGTEKQCSEGSDIVWNSKFIFFPSCLYPWKDSHHFPIFRYMLLYDLRKLA